MPIDTAHATGAAACSLDRISNRVTPDYDKDQLGRHSDRGVDDNAGRRLRARNASLMGEPRARDVAAHTGDWQEGVDGLADPTDPEKLTTRAGLKPALARAKRER